MLVKLYQHLRTNSLLLYGLVFGLVFLISGILMPKALISFLQNTNQYLLSIFSFYYLCIGLFIVLAALLVIVLPFAKIKLGNEKPAYSYFSWIALLYSTGMGSGLLLRAVQEPVYYFNNPPITTDNVKELALQYTFFHWGFTPWAMYSLFGLIVAYNLYIKKAPSFLHAIIPQIKNRYAKTITISFITLITITGVIASLGLGTGQLIGGINYFFGIRLGTFSLLLSVFAIGLASTLSALTGINKVIKYLADFDFSFSIILMTFIALFLNFNQFFVQTFSAFWNYIIHFFEMSLSIGEYKTSESFTRDWTVFYWAFWLAWVPFTGIFIARVSKGRNIREFIIATILVPTLATIIWFSVFANNGFELLNGNNDQFDNIFTSLFEFLTHFPLHQFTIFLAALLVLISIINSVDSAIFVLGMFSDKGKENPSKTHKLLWGIIITATALGLTAVGSEDLLSAISNLLIIMALPFSFLYLYIIIIFFRDILKPNSRLDIESEKIDKSNF